MFYLQFSRQQQAFQFSVLCSLLHHSTLSKPNHFVQNTEYQRTNRNNNNMVLSALSTQHGHPQTHLNKTWTASEICKFAMMHIFMKILLWASVLVMWHLDSVSESNYCDHCEQVGSWSHCNISPDCPPFLGQNPNLNYRQVFTQIRTIFYKKNCR